ncbi:IS3 family transposase [Fusibacter bizertensis]
MKNNGTRYDQEFKKMIVELYNTTDHTFKSLESEYGVTSATIQRWVKSMTPMSPENSGSMTPHELAELKKEMARMREENENLKKGYGHISEKVSTSSIFETANILASNYNIKSICSALGLPRSTFYRVQKPRFSKRIVENKILKEHITRIYMESEGRYGSPKIREKMKTEQILPAIPSIKRIKRLMKQLGIFPITIKKFKPYKSQSTTEDLPNLLKRDFNATKPNEKWVADITYIHTLKDGWCYLASILDLYTHKVVGYSFGQKMDKNLVINALDKAMLRQRKPENVILHTDRGSQYLSTEYIVKTDDYKCRRSYSAKGNPYDNAVIESFHAILKKEEVYRKVYCNFSEAQKSLFKYIEGWYNKRRIHGSIFYMTPNEFEGLAV